MSESNKSSSGIGFMGAMFLIFLTLKLCGVITWSWWLVTMPLWFGFAFVASLCFLLMAIIALMDIFDVFKSGGK